MGRLNIDLLGIKLDNPLILCSGTAGYGHELKDMTDLSLPAAISLKGTTLLPRFGNEPPRIAEAPSGIINSVGLQNPGAEKVIREEIPKCLSLFDKPLIANLCGFSADEYVSLAELFSDVPAISFLEINISCPNVEGGCMSFGADPKKAALLIRAVRRVSKKPIIIKLTPNTADIAAVARAVEEEGADAVSLINTISAMRIDLRTKRPLLSNTTGGLSGPAVFPVALRMVYEVYEAVSIPVIGMGGISSERDVLEMMMAGASAVGIGSAFLRDPGVVGRILDRLPPLMDTLNIDKISGITGAAHR